MGRGMNRVGQGKQFVGSGENTLYRWIIPGFILLHHHACDDPQHGIEDLGFWVISRDGRKHEGDGFWHTVGGEEHGQGSCGFELGGCEAVGGQRCSPGGTFRDFGGYGEFFFICFGSCFGIKCGQVSPGAGIIQRRGGLKAFE